VPVVVSSESAHDAPGVSETVVSRHQTYREAQVEVERLTGEQGKAGPPYYRAMRISGMQLDVLESNPPRG
jgi:hypothetical protein